MNIQPCCLFGQVSAKNFKFKLKQVHTLTGKKNGTLKLVNNKFISIIPILMYFDGGDDSKHNLEH
jgi:hypothetical protein